jgi:MoxR-like ATPase
VFNYALDIVRATRPNDPAASDFVRHWLSWGAGPRAGQYLILAGKARALMLGRLHVTLEDIAAVASPVLRHRIVPNFNAEAEGIVVEQIIDKLGMDNIEEVIAANDGIAVSELLLDAIR